MVLLHAAIGLGEAVITGLVVRYILVRRPDLFAGPDVASSEDTWQWGQIVLGGVGVALAVAVFLSPFAYAQPDGLEFVGEKLHLLPGSGAATSPAPFSAPIADYELKLPGLEHLKVATSAAGVVGTLVVFGVAWAMAKILPARQNEEATSHAV